MRIKSSSGRGDIHTLRLNIPESHIPAPDLKPSVKMGMNTDMFNETQFLFPF